ncbi:YSIRK-type signal peptide-containing protein, partial [Staphylococcus epidermidis]
MPRRFSIRKYTVGV